MTLARLDAFCAHHQLTRFPVLLAAVGTAMAEISGRSDLLVGVSISQRRTLADESIIGELTGTYPVRLDLSRATGFTQVCRATADSFGQVEQHSGIHYRALHPPVPADRAFQLDFSMNKVPAEQPDFAGLVASSCPRGARRTAPTGTSGSTSSRAHPASSASSLTAPSCTAPRRSGARPT